MRQSAECVGEYLMNQGSLSGYRTNNNDPSLTKLDRAMRELRSNTHGRSTRTTNYFNLVFGPTANYYQGSTHYS